MPMAPRTIRFRQTKRPPDRRPNSHNSAQRGYNWKWRRSTAAWLNEQFQSGNVNCALCGKLLHGNRKAIHVDHKVPPSRLGPVGSNEYLAAFYDQENWQLSCPRCNMSKQDR